MTPKTSLFIDWNGTIQWQIAGIITYVKANYTDRKGQSIELSPLSFDRWNPPLGRKLGISEAEFNQVAWGNEWVFRNSPPYPGAKEAIQRLSEGYQIIIATSTNRPDLVEPWFEENGIYFDDILWTQDKCKIKGLLIDDAPETIERRWCKQLMTVRRELLWNCHLTNVPALKDWRHLLTANNPSQAIAFQSG